MSNVTIDLATATAAQMRAFEKKLRTAKAAAVAAEKLANPSVPRGRGVMSAIYKVALAQPKLTGDKLFTAVCAQITLPGKDGTKTSKSVVETERGNFLRAVKYLKDNNVDVSKVSLD